MLFYLRKTSPNFFNVRICRDRQVLSALKGAAVSALKANVSIAHAKGPKWSGYEPNDIHLEAVSLSPDNEFACITHIARTPEMKYCYTAGSQNLVRVRRFMPLIEDFVVRVTENFLPGPNFLDEVLDNPFVIRVGYERDTPFEDCVVVTPSLRDVLNHDPNKPITLALRKAPEFVAQVPCKGKGIHEIHAGIVAAEFSLSEICV